MFVGTRIVRLRFTLLKGETCTIDELRVPVGPPAWEVMVRVTFPWKKFKLPNLSTMVALAPGWRVSEFGVAVMLKSVATTVKTTWCETLPSLVRMVIG